MTLDTKLGKLQSILRDTGGLVVAYSGGVDSTLLAAVAHEVLGEKAIAVTAISPTYPEHEQQEARELALRIGVRHEVIQSNELENENYASNPTNRCYFCKDELFTRLIRLAPQWGVKHVADGTNADDLGDHRPGRVAAKENGVLSPLAEAGLSKLEIRELSRQRDLPTADKPAFPCLGSRFPYGTRITLENLRAVDSFEAGLRALGFREVRVRHYEKMARLEVPSSEFSRMVDPAIRSQIVKLGKASGYHYVAMDLEGFRSGSLNELLKSAGSPM